MAALGIFSGDNQHKPTQIPSGEHTYTESEGKVWSAKRDPITAVPPENAWTRNLEADTLGLRETIKEILKKNPIGLSPEGHYLPDNEYDRLFTQATIQCALGGSHETLELVKYVLKHAKKTFATLLLVFSDCENRRIAMDALKR